MTKLSKLCIIASNSQHAELTNSVTGMQELVTTKIY